MRAIKALFILLCAGFLFVVQAAPALAQAAETAEQKPFDKRRLMVQPRNADGSIVAPRFQDDPILWISVEQRNYYAAMSKSLNGLGGGSDWAKALMLMLLSFGYGVFHAAGPGHGKAVVSGWLLATESQLRRGILVAFLSAMLQAIVAIALVGGALLLLSGAAAAAKIAASWLELASFAMIAAMGAYVIWGGLKALPRKVAIAATTGHHFEIVNHRPATHQHVHGQDCDHQHAPDAQAVAGDWSWHKAATLSLAVGLRPCSGAILVLLLAYQLNIFWAGVASTLVMGLGTFITVAVVATIAVYAKQLAQRFAQNDAKWLNWLNIALRLGGGSVIFLFGLGLLLASWQGLGDSGF